LSTTLVRFDKNCGTFGKGKNPMSSTTLGQFALEKIKLCLKKKKQQPWGGC
jgi:hypothetical protein